MNKISKSKKISGFPYLPISILLLIIVFTIPAIGLVNTFFASNAKTGNLHGPHCELLDGWEYYWGNPENGKIPESDWMVIKRPMNPPHRNGQTLLWLRHKMPDRNWEVPALLIDGKGVLLTFKVYIDDKLIYEFGRLTRKGKGNLSGISSHLIHLGDDFRGKTLKLMVFSDYSNIGIRGKVLIGSEPDLMQDIIKKDFNRFVIGLFMVFIGILDLVIYKESLKSTRTVSMLGILAISVGIYTLNVTAIKDLIYSAPVFWFNLYIAAMFLIPVGAMGFIWQTFRPVYGNFYHQVWRFHLVYAVIGQIVFVLILNAALPMVVGSILLEILRILLILEMGVIVGVGIKDAFKKGNVLARVYLCGFIPIIVSGVHDSLVGLGKIQSSYSFVPWALMVFILSLEIIKRQQNIRTRNRLKRYARELEVTSREKTELISELHDGLGGLLTSIKFLSEMGKKSPSAEGMKETLNSISKLSSDSLIEIGSFMQSLDEQDITWPIIVENFYRTGKKMVEPLGIFLDFKDRVDLEAKKPNSVLFLNLLRIYKEGLTNILKHSEATHVIVRINITKTKLRLSIKDDGKGFGTEITKGRGLANMRARAQKLNAKFTLDSGNGTCLILELQFESDDS